MTPEQATERGLKYESSDESVVTVDENGVLSGIGAGTADVTAFSTDGTKRHASVKVRVSRRDDVGVEKTDEGSGISVKLTGFRSNEGRSVFTPERGSVFVYPAFELQNGGSEGVNVDTGSFSVMCDGTYRSYSFNAAQCEEQSLNGMLAPGEMRTGEVGLEIPKKWKEITLTLSFGWCGEELTFVLFNR